MAITVNGDNATMVGFKFDDGQNNATTKYEDTVVIVNDGRLMFNRERLGLTELEKSILDKAIQDKLLSNVRIELSADNNPYELTNESKPNYMPKNRIILTAYVNGNLTTLVNVNGDVLSSIDISMSTTNGTHVSLVALNKTDNYYSKSIFMNQTTNNDTNEGAFIAGYMDGGITIHTDLYIQITDEFGAKHIIPLAKPDTYVKPGGNIYYGATIDSKVGTTDNNFKYALGVNRFTDETEETDGFLALNIGTMTVDDKFQPSVQDNIVLTYDSLSSSASGRTFTLSPDSEGNFYGIVVLPQTINLGKFANSVVDTTVFGGKIYNATNVANNADSPFILLYSTDFSASRTDGKTAEDFSIMGKKVIYNVYRTKNLLVSPITIRL